MEYIQKILEKLKSRKVILTGCTDEEIVILEKNSGLSMPKCYKEFLQSFGKSMSEDRDKPDYYDYGSFVGNSVFLEDLPDNKPGLEELLQEDSSSLVIPEEAFVFYGSQGILYAFFKTDEGDDPPVYGYSEGFEGDSFPKIATSLSSFYTRYLEGDQELFKILF